MRIEDVQRLEVDGRSRLAATAIWETRSSDPVDLYFEVPAEHATALSGSPDPFLVGCSVLAALAGEERLFVAGADPYLVAGVATGLAHLADWNDFKTIDLETEGWVPSSKRDGARITGSLLSGGIDSLALLRLNHLQLPANHPHRIKGCILVNWNVGTDGDDLSAAYMSVENKRSSLEAFGAHSGVTVVPVYSNILRLLGYPRGALWSEVLHGMAFAAAAHSVSGAFHTVSIAASSDIRKLAAGFHWGSHPMIDGKLTSSTLRFVYDGEILTRLEKTAVVAEWPEALAVMTVCTAPYEVRIKRQNCGRCEKCVRTALAFEVLDKTAEGRVSGLGPVSSETIRGCRPRDLLAWEDLALELAGLGNFSRARAVRRMLSRSRRAHRLRPIMSKLSRVDRLITGGRLRRLLKT